MCLALCEVAKTETTGTGDAINGGFAVALAEGMDPENALRFGCATAGIFVTRLGTAQSMPNRFEIDALLAANEEAMACGDQLGLCSAVSGPRNEGQLFTCDITVFASATNDRFAPFSTVIVPQTESWARIGRLPWLTRRSPLRTIRTSSGFARSDV